MMRVLRAADRVATPWKNAGGVTREVCAWPPGAGLDDFDWRISLAEVRADGPFSMFAGVDRLLAVLQGRLLLRIAGHEDLVVAAGGPTAAFPGDAPTLGQVLEGPVLDLNVMVRRGAWSARLETVALRGEHTLAASSGRRLVLAWDGEVVVSSSEITLQALDALHLEPAAAPVVLAGAARLYVATLEPNFPKR